MLQTLEIRKNIGDKLSVKHPLKVKQIIQLIYIFQRVHVPKLKIKTGDNFWTNLLVKIYQKVLLKIMNKCKIYISRFIDLIIVNLAIVWFLKRHSSF